MKKSQNIYDNEIFFEGYKKLRNNKNSLNVIEEKPALFSLTPSLNSKKSFRFRLWVWRELLRI